MVVDLIAARNGPKILGYMQFGTERGYENIQIFYEILLSQKA
jgi:hypothetical protein